MTAWQRLIANSSLALGTAWQHLTNQITGGSGVVVNTGATAVLADRAAAVTLASRPLAVAVADTRLAIALSPGITVVVTTKPIQI